MADQFLPQGFRSPMTRGVRAAWSGLEISAGPQEAVAPTSNAPAKSGDFFVYGTAFYRPPNPPPAMRREMLKAIAQEYKFNIIRIYSAWPYLNPEPGRFDFAELEEVMSYCDEFGLKVLMGVILEDAPYWLEAAHPETRFVNAKGQARRLTNSGNNVSGGWPGLCLDWEPVRQAAANFIGEMAKTVSAHPSMYAYDCWNEPRIQPATRSHHFSNTTGDILYCYCAKTVAGFQRWLQQRYGTLDHLNEAWVRRYSRWEEIYPPHELGTYLDWVDWRRYMIDRSTEEMRFRVQNVRAVDTRSILESHAGRTAALEPIAASGINPWRLAEVVEVWGLSDFARWDTAPNYVMAAKLDMTRCNAGNKSFWMTELQGGHGSQGLFRSRNMRSRDIRVGNWLAVITGAKGLLYWAYHAEATGSESSGFGLVNRDGSPSERVFEAANDNRLIQQHWDVIRDYRPKADVAILFDQDNSLLSFAMSGNEDVSVSSFRGYYKALWNSDVWVDFIESAGLENSSYRVIIAPWHLIGKQQTLNRLRQFVENGGTLLLETGFGMYNERMFFNPVIPPVGLAEVFGYREGENFAIEEPGSRSFFWQNLKSLKTDPEPVYAHSYLEFSSPLQVRVKAHTFLTPIATNSATVIARYGETAVAAMKKLGRGQVYYFGTNLGASIEAGDSGALELVSTIVKRVVQPQVSSEKLRPRLIEGEKRSLLVVFNDGAENRTASIRLPVRYTRATDLYADHTQTAQQNTIQVTVPYEDALAWRLE